MDTCEKNPVGLWKLSGEITIKHLRRKLKTILQKYILNI